MDKKRKVRTIVIDGVEIETDLHAVEIADLPQKMAEIERENHRLESEIESLTEFKEEHDIMKHFIISNKLWENFLNYDEFIKWLRKEDSNE